ncbi:MAG: muramoyltetrapeptide carboxypeptidase [Arcticibacterium sp.]
MTLIQQSLIAPKPISRGDKIGVVSIASVLDEARLLKGKKILEETYGFEVILGSHALDKHHHFAGNDTARLADFQEMLDRADIKAILAGRGGYGTSRIIDDVNWDSFKANPKWIVGFSDITMVHLKLQSLGYQSIHGPMMVTMDNEGVSTESLLNALSGSQLVYQERGHNDNKIGDAEGQIIGGNLCLLAHNIGSTADLSFNGKILFIEDVGEYLYNIDRMMIQLKRAGKLDNLAGAVIGQFSNSKENSTAFGKTAYEIIQEHLSPYHFPVCYDFPIGHETENRAIRCGEKMKLEVRKDFVRLSSGINLEILS